MSYERTGFNPLSQEGPFPIEKITVQGFPIHIVDTEALLKKATTEGATLVDTDFPTASFARHLVAKVAPGKNTDGEDARLYETTIQLEPGTASPSRFGHHFGYHMDKSHPLRPHGRGRIWVFADPHLPHARFINDIFDGFDDVAICDSKTDQLLVRNQYQIRPLDEHIEDSFYPYDRTNDQFWSGHRRLLVAPSNERADEKGQLLFHLGSMILAAKVASAMGSYRTPTELKLDDIIITPNGPLYRNPDTGEYVHNLGRESIEIQAEASSKEEAQKTTESEDAGERPVTFDTLYGIDGIKADLAPAILAYKHPELAKKWRTKRPAGILLKGPAGTGKTSIVYALAHEIGATVRAVRGDEIHSSYIGESEQKVMNLFNEVRDVTTPTILFFDEFEGLFYTTDSKKGAAGTINAVAGIFKTETARIAESNPNVIFAAATNYVDRIDPALIRSGRFDVQLTVGLPDASARGQIFAGLIAEGLDMSPEEIINNTAATDAFRIFDAALLRPEAIEQLAADTEDMSGADIRTVLQNAALKKALAEAEGTTPGPVTLADLQREIIRMRRG